MQKLDKVQKIIFDYYKFSSSRSSRINKNCAYATATSYDIPSYKLISEILEKG
jgi:hypothetical protein